MSEKAMRQALRKSGVRISDWGQNLLDSEKFDMAEQAERIDLASLTVAELGFPNGATTREIYEAAAKLGLELCPAEVGPRLRMQPDTEQTLGEYFAVAMEPITDSGGDPFVFFLHRGDVGPGLDAAFARPGSWWLPSHRFVFRLRKEPSHTWTI